MAEAGERHPHPAHPQLYVFRRPRSRFYYAETCVDSRKDRRSLKTDRLGTALKLAGEWFRDLQRATAAQDKDRRIDRLSSDPTIGELFASWRASLPAAKRPYHDTKWGAVGPFWRAVLVTDVTPKLFREYYLRRRRVETQYGKPPTNGTLKKDAILLRLIMSHAVEEGFIPRLPIIPSPGKIGTNPRPWLTAGEWDHLKTISQQRIDTAPNERTRLRRIDTDHFMRFMVASCGRVDEILGLRFSDCRYRLSDDGKQTVLVCRVTGKRGTRDLVAEDDAADVISLREGKPDDMVFAEHHRDAFRELLIAAKLRTDKFGNERNFKSLRATAISRLVLARKPLDFIARNAGTSITMIDLYYAKRLTAEMHIHKSHPIEVPVSEGRD
jgi:hypothetical protein